MTLKEKIEIPKYTLGEEIMSAVTHGVGALLSIAALTLCVIFSAINGSCLSVVSSAIYGSSLIILYTMSTLYHSLKVNNAKRVFRIIDHCSIYLLIAGTYTPYTLLVLPRNYGIPLFLIIWGIAILGIVLNSIDLKKYKVISLISYLVLGWAVIFTIKPLMENLALGGLIFLLLGGISYTLGAIFYGFGKKVKYMHSIFHIFVLIGSILQFFSILFFVI